MASIERDYLLVHLFNYLSVFGIWSDKMASIEWDNFCYLCVSVIWPFKRGWPSVGATLLEGARVYLWSEIFNRPLQYISGLK